MSSFDRLLTLVAEEPLSHALPVALVAATKVDDSELVGVLEREVAGYVADNPAMSEECVIPKYRAIPGTWFDDYGRRLLVRNPRLGFINEIRLRQGVAELEGYATAAGVLSIREPNYVEVIRSGFDVDVTTFRFQPSSVSQVLANLRVHILGQLEKRRKVLALPHVRNPDFGDEILLLNPQIHGVGVDLKALWRRVFGSKE